MLRRVAHAPSNLGACQSLLSKASLLEAQVSLYSLRLVSWKQRPALARQRLTCAYKRLALARQRLTCAYKRLALARQRLTCAYKRLALARQRLTCAYKRLALARQRLTCAYKRLALAHQRLALDMCKTSLKTMLVIHICCMRPRAYGWSSLITAARKNAELVLFLRFPCA
eukprot:1196322-Prorocentrum_minimum.AAC.8